MDNKPLSLGEKVLYGDAAKVIAKYLSPRDIVAFCDFYPKHYKKLFPYFKHTVMYDVDHWFRCYFGNKYQDFVEAMILDKAVISGSFILQIILGEKWSESDIDIFVPCSHRGDVKEIVRGDLTYTHIEKFLYRDYVGDIDTVAWHFHSEELRIYNNMRANTGKLKDAKNIYTTAFGMPLGISIIREYPIRPKFRHKIISNFHNDSASEFKTDCSHLKMFQVVELYSVDQTETFIEKTFDFDICKNFFQYVKNVDNITGKETVEMKLVLKRPGEVIRKRAGFKPCANLDLSLKRCQKYISRGFTFYDDLNNATHVYHITARDKFNALMNSILTKDKSIDENEEDGIGENKLEK